MWPLVVGRIVLTLMTLIGVSLVVLHAMVRSPAAQHDFRALLDQQLESKERRAGPSEFYFTRGVYSSPWTPYNWSIDFPKADQQFMAAVNTLVDMDADGRENAVRLDDPNLRRFPFLYILEIAGMFLTPSEVQGLRGYLLAGGFLVVDDFWGQYAYQNLEQQLRKVLPDHQIVDIPKDHPIFDSVYQIEELVQVPAIGNYWSGRTTECYGCDVFMRGVFDKEGRLMVVINGNTDLGDAWEWFERPEYPLRFSSFAVRMGVNFIVYAMSH